MALVALCRRIGVPPKALRRGRPRSGPCLEKKTDGGQIALPRIDTFHITKGKIREVRTTLDYQALMQQFDP